MAESVADELRRLRFFVRQDLDQRFKGNALGVTWAVLLPLLQFMLFALLFVAIFRARVPGLDERGYLAFLSLGIWPWFAFAEAVGRSVTALGDNAGLIQKVAVSPWLLVASRVIVAFILHGIGLILVMAVLAAVGMPLHWDRLPVAVLAWLTLLPLALAVGMVLALLQVFIRDLQQVAPYLINALMFLSPIIYAASMLPAWGQELMHWNPLATVVSGVRDTLIWDALALPVWPGMLTAAAICTMALLIYRRLRPHVIDFL